MAGKKGSGKGEGVGKEIYQVVMQAERQLKEVITSEVIGRKIFIIRGQKVMLDKDLADLYGVKATRLREQVKRNKKRFPQDFMFQLSNEETDVMVSQNAIPSRKHLGGFRPYVFTEQGVAMLATVLNSNRARRRLDS